MRDEHSKIKVVLLVILTVTVIILTIVVATKYFYYDDNYNDRNNGRGYGYFFKRDNNNVVYRGEIVPEQIKTREKTVSEMPKTTMQFYESKYDFGVVPEGQVLKHAFRFKNTGSNPLMIAKTDVTCGCTVPEFPPESIAPGADGELTVVYSTSGKSGAQQKNITVHSNTLPESITISIEADIR